MREVSRADALLRTILEDASAVVGTEFLDKVVEIAATTLGTRTAFVATSPSLDPTELTLLANWTDGHRGELLDDTIDGTPNALGAEVAVYDRDVQVAFPHDGWLSRLGASAYAAVQIPTRRYRGTSRLGVLHDEARAFGDDEMSALRVVASRVAGELDRMQADEERTRFMEYRDLEDRTSPVGIVHRHTETDVVWSNEQFAQFVGRSAAECRRIGWDNVIHPDDLGPFLESVEQLETDGAPITVEVRFLHPEGDTRWLQISAVALLDSDGNVVEITAFVTDATTERRARADLAAAARQLETRTEELESSFNAFRDVIIRFSPDGTFLRVWANDQQLLGRPATELIGDDIAVGLPADVAQRMRRAIRTTSTTSKITTVRFRIDRDGELTHFEGRITPLNNGDVMAVVRDVTEVRALEDRLVHAQTMQTVGRLAGGVAHDFNNVLHVIRGHASALGRHLDDVESTDRRLDAITRAVDRTSTLVNRLLLISRPTPNDPTPSIVDDFIRGLEPVVQQILGDRIDLRLELDAGRSAVAIDDSRFENVILNLASNARDAMPDGGTVTVRTTADDDDSVQIDFSDVGEGMDDETVSQIFEPFFSTKAPGLGTGLGLATTFAAITEAYGSIEVTSEPGRGSTFSITFPCVEPDPPQPAPTDASAATRTHQTEATQTKPILVVEDDADVLELCTESLRDLRYRVYQARSGIEALELLEQVDGIDALLTDVMMPDMSGPELAETVRHRWPDLPVIFMSGYVAGADDADAPLATESILHKPFSDRDLAKAVRSALA